MARQRVLRIVSETDRPPNDFRQAQFPSSVVAEDSDPIRNFLADARHVFSNDALGLRIASIAWPALLALAAEPLASLTDTFFIGRIGAVEVAAVGVAIAVFNVVSKVFNFPLLNVTTSLVAEEEAGGRPAAGESGGRIILPAVSAALLVGAVVGLVEAVVLGCGTGPILSVMGVPLHSAMREPASQYLAIRAVGAPAVVVSMAVQGVFRGLKDTKTPLAATLLATAANVGLDPLLMFGLGWGTSGAALATVVSQYAMATLLVFRLQKRVKLLPERWEDLGLHRFLKSGGLLLGRTVALLSTMTLATAMAARQGATAMAAHQICLQLWLAFSLLSDSLALASQTLLASAFARQDRKEARAIMFRTLQLGLALGILMAVFLSLGAVALPRIFSADEAVLAAAAVIMPFVAATQPITSLAFVYDGIHYGAADFGYAASAMVVLVLPVLGTLLLAPQYLGLPGVWMGLTLLMTMRMLAGFYRVGTGAGPWLFLRGRKESGDAKME